jgi:hypothetical protein
MSPSTIGGEPVGSPTDLVQSTHARYLNPAPIYVAQGDAANQVEDRVPVETARQ